MFLPMSLIDTKWNITKFCCKCLHLWSRTKHSNHETLDNDERFFIYSFRNGHFWQFFWHWWQKLNTLLLIEIERTVWMKRSLWICSKKRAWDLPTAHLTIIASAGERFSHSIAFTEPIIVLQLCWRLLTSCRNKDVLIIYLFSPLYIFRGCPSPVLRLISSNWFCQNVKCGSGSINFSNDSCMRIFGSRCDVWKPNIDQEYGSIVQTKDKEKILKLDCIERV